MDLITTHVGADFDAFASTAVARRIHPGAAVFFPGSKEESVRRMLDSGVADLPEIRQREVEPGRLRRLILCDVRQPDRLGVVASWLRDRPDLELTIYDHHPASPGDLAAAAGRIDPEVGCTSTLMVEELRRLELEPTPVEASLLLMGIYEDTGSLSHAPTSRRDLEAAGWLLERGGDLELVRRFALRGLDAERLEILHRMSDGLEIHRIRGRRVGLTAVELGGFIDELAPLVGRCLELFDLTLLFAVLGEGERVTVIARGTDPACDLGGVLESFAGGGGHPTAASASLRGVTALETRERLLAHLAERLPPAARAAELMLAGFTTVSAGASVAEAKESLNRQRLNAAPVTAIARPDRVIGAVTRQILDAALQHGLEHRPVESVMDRELVWVEPDAPADKILERIVRRHPRFVLVGHAASGRPMGLVTRMELLRHLHGRREESAAEAGEPIGLRQPRESDAAALLGERLAPAVARRVEVIAAAAREIGASVFLVGGLVRDLLLGRDNRDVDLVVEGDGPDFARRLAAALGGRVRVHPPFMTAVVVDPEGFHIDVATARSEFYRAPAALPEVQTSPIRQDLYRRDFTINTLAIRLGPGRTPVLIDYFGGLRDLRRGVLRVLHSLSFIDDPTRVLRAVRLEARLAFAIAPETLRLVEIALAEGVFGRLSGARLRDEIRLLLDEPMTVLATVERLGELGLLGVLHPDLALDASVRRRLRQAAAALDWYLFAGLESPPVAAWRLFLLSLAWELAPDARLELARRVALPAADRRLLESLRPRLESAAAILADSAVRPHRAAEILEPLSGEELLLLMAQEDEGVRRWVRRDLTEFRVLELGIGGDDLLALGFEAGPGIGEALAAVRAARLDGRIGPDEELVFARRHLRRRTAGAGGETR